jgi:cobalamin synthase
MGQNDPPLVGVWFRVILVHFHWVLTSSGTSDQLRFGFLVTLGGCRHLDGLEQLGVID